MDKPTANPVLRVVDAAAEALLSRQPSSAAAPAPVTPANALHLQARPPGIGGPPFAPAAGQNGAEFRGPSHFLSPAVQPHQLLLQEWLQQEQRLPGVALHSIVPPSPAAALEHHRAAGRPLSPFMPAPIAAVAAHQQHLHMLHALSAQDQQLRALQQQVQELQQAAAAASASAAAASANDSERGSRQRQREAVDVAEIDREILRNLREREQQLQAFWKGGHEREEGADGSSGGVQAPELQGTVEHSFEEGLGSTAMLDDLLRELSLQRQRQRQGQGQGQGQAGEGSAAATTAAAGTSSSSPLHSDILHMMREMEAREGGGAVDGSAAGAEGQRGGASGSTASALPGEEEEEEEQLAWADEMNAGLEAFAMHPPALDAVAAAGNARQQGVAAASASANAVRATYSGTYAFLHARHGSSDLRALVASLQQEGRGKGDTQGAAAAGGAGGGTAESKIREDSAEAPSDAGDDDWLANSLFQEGRRLLLEGRLEEAIAALEACLQVSQEQQELHSEAWRLLGQCHSELEDDKAAILCLEQAVGE